MAENVKNNKKTSGMKSFIGGTILTDERVTRQLPFLLFLAALGILLITNRNWSERTIRQIEIQQDSIDELRSESITLSAKVMDASRPSKVLKKVRDAGLNLEEPVTPPKKIEVREE